MIREICRYLAVATVAMILAGCINRDGQQPAPINEVESGVGQPVQPEVSVPEIPALPSQPDAIEQPQPTIPATPKVRIWNWTSAMQPMVNKMLQADGVIQGSVLLVDEVNNHTNGNMQTSKATEALRGVLANNPKFTLVSAQQLSMARRQLGLSPQDSLGSRSKAIGIARNVGASYVLYSNASGNVNTPLLKMQLMLVKTGEIIWSGSGAVQEAN